jgi:hypothetical protein
VAVLSLVPLAAVAGLRVWTYREQPAPPAYPLEQREAQFGRRAVTVGRIEREPGPQPDGTAEQ